MKKRRSFLSLFMTLVTLTVLASPVRAQVTSEHLQAARDYMQARQWNYAGYEWRNILNSDPRHVEAHIGLATALMNGGFTDEAVRHLEETAGRLKHPDIDLALTRAYARADKTNVAASRYQEMLRRDPLHSTALRELKQLLPKLPADEREAIDRRLRLHAQAAREKANKAFEGKQYKAAAKYFEVVASYSRAPGPVNDYGVSLLLSGDTRQAFSQLQTVSRKTGNWRVLSNAAVAQLSLGRTYEARMMLEKAIALCRDDKQKALLYNNLGYVYETAHKNMQALFSYEKAVQLDPALTKAQMNRAYVHQKEHQYEQALTIYKSLAQKDPGNAEIWNRMGFVYELMHDKRRAINAYRTAIKLDPAMEEAYLNLGTLYRKLDKMEEANKTLRAMMELKFRQIETGEGTRQAKALNANLARYTGLFLWAPVQVKTAAR